MAIVRKIMGVSLQILQDLMALNSTGGGWSTGDSHDSGIGGSPPFEGIRGCSGVGAFGGNNIISNGIPSGIKIQIKQKYYDIIQIYLCV